MINRFTLTVYSFFLTAMSLFAQASPEPVNSPQRGTTYADEASGGSIFLLIAGGVIVLLIVVLLFMRRKNAPTNNRLHKY